MRRWRGITLWVLGSGAWALLVPNAAANPVAALKIPPHEMGCTLCHSGSGATAEIVPTATANDFTRLGLQWVSLDPSGESGRFWADLAPLNADNDGCSNGCELDDAEGTFSINISWTPSSCNRGNPNESDCVLPINDESWSTLKSLFGESR